MKPESLEPMLEITGPPGRDRPSQQLPQSDASIYGTPLRDKHIRLLRLQSQSTFQNLQFELQEHDLTPSVKFQAISYTWGDPTPDHTITCNGKEVAITQSLHEILHQFSEDHNHGWLWTDALCINQADLDEKSRQVKLMAEIYKIAVEVVVWLGKEEPTDQSGINLMDALYDTFGLPTSLEEMAGHHDRHREALTVPECTDERWLHVRNILRRQYV